jgi:uncharacterized protein YbjQ (UPF0145 family)
MSNIIVTTTSTVDSHKITRYIAIASGEVILGGNVVRDFMAGIRNITGGRVKGYEETIREARQNAIQEMVNEAGSWGANGVVGCKVDYETLGEGNMLMVTASGTAVMLQPE